MKLNEFLHSTSSRFLAALAYRDYRIMWYATMSAGGAAWALIVVRGALVYSMTESSALVGIVTFAAMGPQFIVPFFSGYLADRFDRRRILSGAYAVNVLHNVVLASLAFTGNIEIWHLVSLSVLDGTARATQIPTSASLVPNLVPPDKLLNAVALSSATMQASRLVGPAFIAPLLAYFGIGWSFVVCTVLYLISFGMTLRIQTASTGMVDKTKGGIANVLAGFSYVYSHPFLLSLVLLSVLHCALTMSFESLIPVFVSNKLGIGQEGFAYVMTGVGAGALLIVTILAGIQSEHVRGRLVLWLGVISGLSPIAMAFAFNLSGAWMAAAFMGGSQAGFMTLTHVVVQTIVPDSVRGRVSSIFTFHVGGMMAIFNLVNGAVSDVIDVSIVFIVTGLAFVIVMGFSLMVSHIRLLYSIGVNRTVAPQASASS